MYLIYLRKRCAPYPAGGYHEAREVATSNRGEAIRKAYAEFDKSKWLIVAIKKVANA